jgi:hypothetical protein
MTPEEEARLAALLIAQAQQLQERAADVGVTAFCGKPTFRGKPNERFLQNTLKNVASSNRRVEERVMWKARDRQQELVNGRRRESSRMQGDREGEWRRGWEREGGGRQDWGKYEETGRGRVHGRKRSRSRSQEKGQRGDRLRSGRERNHGLESGEEDAAGDSCSRGWSSASWTSDDEQQRHQQPGTRVRGRGTTGSAAATAGPFLPQELRGTEDDDSQNPEIRRAMGPQKPGWMFRHDEAGEGGLETVEQEYELLHNSASVQRELKRKQKRLQEEQEERQDGGGPAASAKQQSRRHRGDGSGRSDSLESRSSDETLTGSSSSGTRKARRRRKLRKEAKKGSRRNGNKKKHKKKER